MSILDSFGRGRGQIHRFKFSGRILRIAARQIRNACVVPAKLVADITAAGDGSRCLYCTVGLLQFPKAQPRAELEQGYALVAALVTEHEIGLLI